MSGGLPWALVVQAGDLDVNRRAELEASLAQLVEFHRHWVLLATCHRVELYGFGPSPAQQEMRRLEGDRAVRQLFKVAAGLESAVVGESEILGQVRDALARARERGTDERVARLFECAIATGRAARAQALAGTELERDGLAERAVSWLAARTRLSGRPVLVVGTGTMGAALAAAAAAAGGVVTVAGRLREAARSPAQLDLAGAARRATEMAAVAVAIRGEWAELAEAGAAPVGPQQPMPPVADLSVPPAVPVGVQRSLGPNFLGIDELWQRAPVESSWAAAAEAAVAGGVAEYMGWLRGRGSVPTLVALRDRGEARRQARVERLLRRLPDLDERARELVEAMSRQLVTDLLHEPISALRSDPDGSQGEAARRLFDL
jgi:glutamyl-tRNA reductase